MSQAPPAASKKVEESRAAYRYFQKVPTRWHDNDLYGHINNIVYYSFFDTVINCYLIDAGGLDIHDGSIIGVAVETQCNYLASLAYPQVIDAGLRVGHLGRSSVRYELGLFAEGVERPAAVGRFVHVFIDRGTRKPVPIPDSLRAALVRLIPDDPREPEVLTV